MGFLAYPKQRFTSATDKPLSGGAVTASLQATGAIPASAPANSYWNELNERLGGELDAIISPAAEYLTKTQSLIAGGDIPDVVQLLPDVPNLPSLLEARFSPLDDHLGGDAVLDYPNLAAIPTYAWESCVFNGSLYGVPFSQPLLSNGLAVRADIVSELGLSTEITDGAQFLDWVAELTDSRAGRWALMKPERIIDYVVAPMMGAPNKWRVEGGTFTSAYATDEFAEAVATVAKMWADGLFHPDALANAAGGWFRAGDVVTDQGGLTSWSGAKASNENPEFALEVMSLPTWDGSGRASMHQLNGIYCFASIHAAEPERITEILRMINWMAAPVGSEEHLFNGYGVEGVHFAFNDAGDPILTEKGATETKVPSGYIGRAAPFIYSAGDPDFAKVQFEYHQANKPASAPLPTRGLYSATDYSDGRAIKVNLDDTMMRIVSGRTPVTEWPSAVDEWRKNGGDTIAAEYEQALADQ